MKVGDLVEVSYRLVPSQLGWFQGVGLIIEVVHSITPQGFLDMYSWKMQAPLEIEHAQTLSKEDLGKMIADAQLESSSKDLYVYRVFCDGKIKTIRGNLLRLINESG